MKFTEATGKEFTEATVKAAALKSTTEQFLWHDQMGGFGVRLRDGGGRYVAQFRVLTKQRRVTLGNVFKVTLKAAQNEAQILFGDVARGDDPVAARRKARVSASHTSRSFEVAIEQFLDDQKGKISQSWYGSTERALRKRFKVLHGLSLNDIDRATVAAALREAAKFGDVSADRNRSALSKFFTWAIEEGICENNPVSGTRRACGNYEVRERTLSHDEIRKVWNALDDYTGFGRCVKLLLLTGLRRCEVGDLRWSEIDFHNGVINIAAERMKNGKPHAVPMSPKVVELLKLCRHRKDSDFLFGRDNGFTDWFKSKKALDALVKVQHWTLHDLRRTASTLMNEELDVAPHVVEAVLAHISGAQSAHSGIAGKYNMAKYLVQKREALNKWAAHIAQIVEPTKGKLKLVA